MPLSERIEALVRANQSQDDLTSALTYLFEAELGRRAPDPSEPDGAMPDRYEDLGQIGIGGMGEVRRVHDRQLGRTMAMKILRPDLLEDPRQAERFVTEAQATAQLQHPGIVPVHELGRLPDGRLYFTMQEVRGVTLKRVIRGVHMWSSASGQWSESASGWTFRRLVDALLRVCEAVAFAHRHGVLHRDLKPENVMVGEHGQVYVLDWGLNRIGPGDDDGTSIQTARSTGDHLATQAGTLAGTPAYMAPEQARGQTDRVGPRTDVYALGAMLYAVLTDGAPFRGHGADAVLAAVLEGPPPSPRTHTKLPLPTELVACCQRAMAREPEDRHADASVLAREVLSWLDGARRRERALRITAQSAECGPEADALRERATALRAEASDRLGAVHPWDPVALKADAWAKQDRAAALDTEADLALFQREQLLRAALTHERALPEAHAALCEGYLVQHRQAEAAHDRPTAARMRALLEVHRDPLPLQHEVRQRVDTYLKGDGALSLRAHPDGTSVTLIRLETVDRRWVEGPAHSLGNTPIADHPLPTGSYVCVLEHAEREPLRYPVHLGRGEHWDGEVHLPDAGALGPEDVWIPGGWFQSGGDPLANQSLPARRLWCPTFVMRRFQVTNREFIAFLDDQVKQGREAEALSWAPRERSAGMAEATPPVYGRRPDGGFSLVPDADGDTWDPEWPVFLVNYAGARAYALWLAEQTGLPWRLPGELEWEKAARGVDGRAFPWGDHSDPTWSCMALSHAGVRLPQPVRSFPVDTSVYGVRGLSGNLRDWCADRVDSGPQLDGDTVIPPPMLPSDGGFLSTRGGAWTHTEREARVCSRGTTHPGIRTTALGFRLVYTPGG